MTDETEIIDNDKPLTQNRAWCYYVSELFMTPNGIIPAVVEEDDPGYAPLIGNGEHASPWYWGMDIETAQRICDESNARIGVTPERAREIVASSIAASTARDARRQEFADRLDQLKRGRA